MIQGLHHVKITIPTGAEVEGRRFYCDLLGLPEIPKPRELQERGGFWLELPNVVIYVGVEDGIDRKATKAHLGYRVDSLEFWRSRLAVAGIPIKESMPIAGHNRFEIQDPFGNRIELQQVKLEI